MTDGTLDEDFATNDRIKRDIEQKAGEHGGYWCGALGVGVGKPVVQRREPNLCSVPNEKKDERESKDARFELTFHGIEVGPQERSHAFTPEGLLGGKVEQDRAEQTLAQFQRRRG